MVFNATFNNISVIPRLSVLLVDETRDPEEITDLTQIPDKLDHIMKSGWRLHYILELFILISKSFFFYILFFLGFLFFGGTFLFSIN